MAQKYRDRLLSAAIRLSDHPTQTGDFIDTADAVIAALLDVPELAKQSKESRLNMAIELLVNLMPDFPGHQGKISAALEQLRLIPR